MRKPLLEWYDREKRDLPWRRTSDPWAIWVSEVMLQQTQVATVIPFWERWLERFPCAGALAEASEQEALSLWQGLGYYRRCRLLQQGARYVVANGMPGSYQEWLKVPGVGRYTAGAIASIAFGEPVPLVDGNVERVYARLAGDRSIGSQLHQNAWAWAGDVLDVQRPGDWNQALMELGATVCKPVNPVCEKCPVREFCVARQTHAVNEIPTPSIKPKTVQLRHAVWIPFFEGCFGVRQIAQGEWWQGMWEFPRVETGEALEVPALRDLVGNGWLESLGQLRHSVTHHRILINLSLVRCETQSPGLRWESTEGLQTLPMPAPQRKCLQLALMHL